MGLLLDKWITLATETIISSAIVNYEKETRKLTRAKRGGVRAERTFGPMLAAVLKLAVAAASAMTTVSKASSHLCSAILSPSHP